MQVGLQMAAKACFDVREAPALWGMMELLSEVGSQDDVGDIDSGPLQDPMETDADMEFVSTHPCHSTRQVGITPISFYWTLFFNFFYFNKL